MKEQLFPIEIKSAAKCILCGRVGAVVNMLGPDGTPNGLQRFKLGVQRVTEHRRDGSTAVTNDWYLVHICSDQLDEDKRHPRTGDIIQMEGIIHPHHISGTDQYSFTCTKFKVFPKEEENILTPY